MDWYDRTGIQQVLSVLGRISSLLLFVFVAVSLAGPSLQAQQTYTVTVTGDEADANPGDGQCETEAGTCTLRAAIQEANQSPTEDTIAFGDISSGGEGSILPRSVLPSITETVVIDGTTEPNYTEGGGPVVVVAGDSLSGGSKDGLDFFAENASESTVRSIALVNFPGEGLEVHNGVNGLTIEGCYIGVAADGSTAKGNGGSGMWIGSNNNTVGTSEMGNVISGNASIGLEITGESNEVRGNRIGVTADGEAPLPNGNTNHQDAGVLIVSASENEFIENVISGNDGQGIFIQGRSYRNDIRDNYIGTSPGLEDQGNLYNGVRIDSSPETDEDQNYVRGGNVIAYNRRHGISINGNYHKVANNFIGTNGEGNNLGNYLGGIRVAARNVIVGTAEVGGEQRSGNVIGFNGRYGIRVLEGGNVQIQGNFVGTNAAGENLGNGGAGIEIEARGSGTQSNNHRIGYGYGTPVPDNPSPSKEERGNVVAHNQGYGVVFIGSGTKIRNAVRGNLMYDNGADGIGLTGEGPTENDAGDADDGPNNLQNTPKFDQGQTQYRADSNEVLVRYKVDSDPSNSSYGTSGLKVDFYVADAATDREGKTYLYTDEYPDTTATEYRETTFAPPNGVDVSESDHIVATATDANGNTSEFSDPSPLNFPVALASFQIEQETGDAVRLTWETTEEVENGRFRIEHQSPSGESFAELDYVEGKGTAEEPQKYSYRVEGLGYGTHTFRLVHVDAEGIAYHLPEKTVELTMDHRYTLTPPSPNPTPQGATFKFGVQESQPVRVALYDALGREVRVLYDSTPPAGQTETVQIDGTGLSSGRYFVRMSGDGIQEVMSLTLLR